MDNLPEIQKHVRDVLRDNKRTELMLVGGIASLFLLGVVSCLMMIFAGHYVWSVPAAGSAFFLKWPIQRLEIMRKRNIALAAAPIFIAQLPPAQAAKEIQKVMQVLFKEEADGE